MMSHDAKARIEQMLRAAPHLQDASPVLRSLMEPLVARRKRHYKGYDNSDYAAVLLDGELGARCSVRGAATNRQAAARSVGSASPARSTVYERLTTGLSIEQLNSIASDIGVQQVLQHCRVLGNNRVKLVMDEFDESSTSRSPYRGTEATTEVGALVRPRKRYLALQKRAGRKNRFDDFLDHDMLGLEHMAVMAETSDGERFFVATFPTQGPAPQVSYVQILNDVQQRLMAVGLVAEVRILDRRWDDVASCKWLNSLPGDWLVRGQRRGRASFRPTNATQRKQLRAQVRGDKPWSRKQLTQRLWQEADFLPNQVNVLGASVRARPFQGDAFECTIVVLYSVRRRHRLQPDELLHPDRNMTSTIILTNRLPGSDTVAWAHATYTKRWSIEVDIKEHKSYVQAGSGPRLFMRVLKEQVAMILENLATYLRAYRARHGSRTFVRYVYDELVKGHVVYDAVHGGWSPAIALAEARPP